MNQNQKYIGLLAMLPLLMVALTSVVIKEAMAAEGPSVEISGINQKGDSSYWVRFEIHTGNEALPDGKLLITSDSDRTEALYRGASAGSVTGVSKILVGIDDKDSLRVSMQDLELDVDPLPVNRQTR